MKRILVLALIICAVFVLSNGAPVCNQSDNGSRCLIIFISHEYSNSKDAVNKSNSDEESSTHHEAVTKQDETTVASAMKGSTKQKRDLLGNTAQPSYPYQQQQQQQQPQDSLQHNLSGVTHKTPEQSSTSSKDVTTSHSVPSQTTSTTEHIGFLGPIQTFFP
ncbi:hypothetical protein O3M35_002309 [Rhynocoris fuscipes]|uniref:Uncharacterized protein n=1 Tax=Rhynocoris fuscipes TaxID=488301 RepID=A0AAW1CQW6_9HEMI